MKVTALFLTTLLGLAFAEDGDKKDHKMPKGKMMGKLGLTADQRVCHRMAKLNHIMKISNNATMMDNIAAKSPKSAQKLKDDAARAEPELSNMQKNSTLVKYCGQYGAHEKLVRQCRTLKHGERLSNKLKNNTALEESAKRRNKSVDEIKNRWQKELSVINRLKSNNTLVDQCNKMKSKDNKKGDKKGDNKKGDAKAEKNEKGKAEKQKSAAANVQVAGTGAFALGLSVLIASLML